MRRVIFGVALAGVVASIALIAQSQLGNKEGTPAVEAPATTPAQPLAPADSVTEASAMQTRETQSPAAAQAPTTPALSPSPAQAPAQDVDGAAVLRKASKAYTNIRSLKANFVNKRDNPLLSSTSTYRGTLYQKQPDRFLMKFSQPAGDIIVSDGRYFWLYYPSADKRQVLRMPATAGGAGGVDLQAQFLGDPLTRFTHTYHGEETIGGRSTHVLTLVPRRNAGYRSLKVWIDAKDFLVRRFILTENNGLVQEFTLSGLVVNPSLSNDLFAFTPPADARIIEQP